MKMNDKKTLLPITLGMLLSTVPALSDATGSSDSIQGQIDSLRTKTVQGTYVGKTPGFLNGPGFYFNADFIYWKPDEDGLEYAYKFKSLNNVGPNFVQNGRLEDVDFEYEPGFRLGAGWTTDYDEWDVYACWTWLHASASDHAHNHQPGVDVLVPLWFPVQLALTNNFQRSAESASGHWRLHYNVLDVNLGRKYFVSKAISLRPHFGLRTAWIDQHFNNSFKGLDYSSSRATHFHGKNDFWGIGLRTGINLQFFFNKNWSMYANGSGALLYGDFDLSHTVKGFDPSNPTNYTRLYHEKEDNHRLRTNLEVGAGFTWETFFHQDRYHFSLSAGWDFVEWFNQNELRKFIGYQNPDLGAGTYLVEDGDLGLQGFTLSARFDF